jgi:adapter protein MecA 1/2
MRLERITINKFKVSLSSDDLFDRGISDDDIWKDSSKWHQLFHEMLDEASDEFGVDIRGQVAVEVFSLQTQGMIMIITMEDDEIDEDFQPEGIIEMQVTVGGLNDFLFEFDEFENIIQLSKRLSALNITEGTLYAKDHKYYLYFDNSQNSLFPQIACILSEYGNPSLLTTHVLKEYGNVIMESNAIEKVNDYFK